jgi:hypothetical protein
MSLVQHVGADAASDSTLGALRAKRLWNGHFLTFALVLKKFLESYATENLGINDRLLSSYLSAPHQPVEQLSRKVCKRDQHWPADIGDDRAGVGDHDVQITLGAKRFCALTMMTACCVTKKRCSKDVDIRCSLPPLPYKA